MFASVTLIFFISVEDGRRKELRSEIHFNSYFNFVWLQFENYKRHFNTGPVHHEVNGITTGLATNIAFECANFIYEAPEDVQTGPLALFEYQYVSVNGFSERRIHLRKVSTLGPFGAMAIRNNNIWYGSCQINFIAVFKNGKNISLGYNLNYEDNNMRESTFNLSFNLHP